MKPRRGKGIPVLYLDYDGVLHDSECYWKPKTGPYLKAPAGYSLFQHAAALERMLRPHPEIQIVLSTSWASVYTCDKAARRLTPALRQRVIGATYHSKMAGDAFSSLKRGEQVSADVVRREPSRWLALDDDSGLSPLELDSDRPIRGNQPARASGADSRAACLVGSRPAGPPHSPLVCAS